MQSPFIFYLECPIPKTRPWEYEIQSDKPHASVCVFAICLLGVDGRVIKLVGLHVWGPWVWLKNKIRKLKFIFENIYKSRVRKNWKYFYINPGTIPENTLIYC